MAAPLTNHFFDVLFTEPATATQPVKDGRSATANRTTKPK